MNSVGKFWAQVPVYILRDHRHRAGHLRVLGAILSCPAPHFPSLNEIAARSGHKPKYCSNMISQMVSFGTLEREQRYNATNVYRLTGFSIDSTTDVDRDSTTDVDTDPTRVMELKESLKEDNLVKVEFEKRLSDSTPIITISLPENKSSIFSIDFTIGCSLGNPVLSPGSISNLKIFEPRITVSNITAAMMLLG